MLVHAYLLFFPVEPADEGISLIEGKGAVYFIQDAVDLAGPDTAVGRMVSDMPGSALCVSGEVKGAYGVAGVTGWPGRECEQGDKNKGEHEPNIWPAAQKSKGKKKPRSKTTGLQ